ncbi:YqaJ viral recombinase family protein [Halomonas janggokensis]|uniref:YqaJ viral recombinase family protein n=1 Tax=Vreelandella janggokensis TaxID=370767 RepID=A0ABT4ITI4_9GAMM|nr:YqaJ viral recombinase family protein [Halomonas janggokensis]MCZ0926491.1 YqaJ viral recombinase family protein [Halomonas janggokensis]MCZ0929029.1 YqaJ viral recombinase family protein [Halomonas janggokensis]
MSTAVLTYEEARQQLAETHRVPTLGMPEDVWLQLRGLGIGASEAAAAVGASEYRTPFEIAERKLGLAADDADANYRRKMKMAMGHVMEPVTASRFADYTGLNVQNFNYMLAHPQHPFMMANLDRRIVGVSEAQYAWMEMLFGKTVKGPGAAELKNVEFSQGWGKPDNVHSTGGLCTSGEVPEDYFIQVQQQLAVSGYEWGFLVVTIAGWETRWYPILRDDELIDDLIALEGDLWDTICRGEMPAIDVEHPKAIDLLKRLYPGTDGSVVEMAQLEHWKKVEEDAKAEIKALETTAKTARAHILKAMGSAAVAAFPDGSCYRRKVVKRAGYEVAPTSYIDCRVAKISKAEKEQLEAESDEQGAAA